MYCMHCGNPMPENGICPICTAAPNAQGKTTVPNVQPVYAPTPAAVPVKPLTTCAWFGPVGIILSAILNALLGFISTLYIEIFGESPYDPSTITAVLYTLIIGILTVAIGLPIYYGLSVAALAKQPAVLRKASAISFLIPWAVYSAVLTLFSSVSSYLGAWIQTLIEGDWDAGYSIGGTVGAIISCILGAVLSYILLYKYYKHIQNLFQTVRA